MSITLIISILFISVYTSVPQVPVIGIYTQNVSTKPSITYTYIAASYVQFLESAGAQVIPLYYNQSQNSLRQILGKINGVLFPGGQDYDLNSTYIKNADFILQYAMEENRKGNVYPVWGTCLGHQLLSFLTSGYDPKVLEHVDQQLKVNNTIHIIDKSAYLFTNWGQKHFEAATEGQGIFYFSHSWAIYTSYFRNNTYLSNFWNLIATSTSKVGQQFTTIQEAKEYPFYSIQFHPEKHSYQPNSPCSREMEPIQIAQIFANNFIEKSRQNKNKFESSVELNQRLIYNFQPIPGKTYNYTMLQLYIFSQSNLP